MSQQTADIKAEVVAWMAVGGSVCAAENKKKPSANGHHDNYSIPLYGPEVIAYAGGLRAERDALRNICAQAYQLAGLVDAPVRVLDALADAANGEIGKRFKGESFLPIDLTEIGEVNRAEEIARAAGVDKVTNSDKYVNRCPHEWYQGSCVHCDIKAKRVTDDPHRIR